MKIILPLLWIMITCLILTPNQTVGEQVIEIDQTAPLLFYTPKTETIEEGKSLEISVQATDNVKVARVALFFRIAGEGKFKSLEMVNTDHHNYSILIPGNLMYGSRVEYYIVAEDEAGNKTMKGFSKEPLSFSIISSTSARPVLKSESHFQDPKRGSSYLQLFTGENIYHFSDQGNQTEVSALAYGIGGQYRFHEELSLDFGITLSDTQSIVINQAAYQTLSGTLYESLSAMSFYLGQRFLFKQISFLVAANYFYSRLSDRNLLDSNHFRITRFPSDNSSSVGMTMGIGFFYPITGHLSIGFDPKITFLTASRFNHLTLPVVVDYEF